MVTPQCGYAISNHVPPAFKFDQSQSICPGQRTNKKPATAENCRQAKKNMKRKQQTRKSKPRTTTTLRQSLQSVQSIRQKGRPATGENKQATGVLSSKHTAHQLIIKHSLTQQRIPYGVQFLGHWRLPKVEGTPGCLARGDATQYTTAKHVYLGSSCKMQTLVPNSPKRRGGRWPVGHQLVWGVK